MSPTSSCHEHEPNHCLYQRRQQHSREALRDTITGQINMDSYDGVNSHHNWVKVLPLKCSPDSFIPVSTRAPWESAREPFHAYIDTMKTCSVGWRGWYCAWWAARGVTISEVDGQSQWLLKPHPLDCFPSPYHRHFRK